MNARIANVLVGLAIGFLGRVAFAAEDQSAHVQVNFSERLGPMEMNRMALGQGGLSDHPMWADRIPEIKSLHPALIRLFVQEYFNLLPEAGRFHFETLDQSVATILATGAKPLMCICFKPHTLFPKVDQDTVEPEDYSSWEQLMFALVKHYQEKKTGIEYWEIGNEPDIGEDGGCPYRFKPESYARYYQRTTGAILKADPGAKVGGPALAGSRSAILPSLLNFCERTGAPLHFVSWHIYNSDPKSIRGTVEDVQSLLKAHPALTPETILDEWNMDLMNPPRDPRFQPAFVCETIWQMKDVGLNWSCYYHIRDWHVDMQQFEPFMSRQGAAFMARWWNRMPQFDGLFDYQNHVRPSYFAFKLLSRLTGDRCRTTSDHASVHVFASHDEQMRLDNLLIWNFLATPVALALDCQGLPSRSLRRHLVLDAAGADSDENARLRPAPAVRIDQSHMNLDVTLDGYAIQYGLLNETLLKSAIGAPGFWSLSRPAGIETRRRDAGAPRMRLDFNEAVSVSHGGRQSKCKLQEAGWNPKARKSLERIVEKGAGKRLPVVFDFDNTIVSGDLSEAMLGVLATEGRLTPHTICKSLCPPIVIPGKKRISIERCSDILEYYEALLRPTAHRAADPAPMANGYVWATEALEGLTVAEAVSATAAAFRLGQELEPKYIQATPGGIKYPAPRFHPEMVELIAELLLHEYDVWIVSATCVWSVRWTILYGLNPLLQKYGVRNGVRPDRVIGLATLLVDRKGAFYKDSILVHESPEYAVFKGSLMKSLRFSRIVQYPAPVYSGKVACILDAIGRNPYLCAGDSPGDHAMMRVSQHRLWIDRLEKPEVQSLTRALITRTGSARWIVQRSSPTGESRFLSDFDETVYW